MFSNTWASLYSYQVRSSHFLRPYGLHRASSVVGVKSTGLAKPAFLSQRCISMGTRELLGMTRDGKWPVTALLFAGAIGGTVAYGAFAHEAHAEMEEGSTKLLELGLQS